MDSTLMQILNHLVALSQENAQLRNENGELRQKLEQDHGTVTKA